MNQFENPVEPPEQFSDTGVQKVPDRWWKAFGDTELNSLVNQALENNFNLKTAWNRLRQSRAGIDAESASLYPNLNVSGSAEQTQTDSTESDQISLRGSSEYEIDLWGRIQSSVEAEQFRARASYTDYQTAALSVSAEVTRTWYQLVEQRNQLDLLNQQIETNRSILELIRTRYRNGQSQRADVLRQEQLLESSREQKLNAQSQLQLLEHQLAVLIGDTPGNGLTYESSELPELPKPPRTGVPAKLIQRRPDVRSALNQLKAADRDLAAAISNQYPRLSLTASLSSTENDANDLFDNWARTFAANLTAPLIDAGQRDAVVAQSRATKKQRLYEYGQATLTAFREVEDALVREQNQLDRIDSLETQLNLAQETIQQVRSQYRNGTSDFLDILNALTEEQQLRRELLTARRTLIEQRISLYRALAGGFVPKSRAGFEQNSPTIQTSSNNDQSSELDKESK